MADSTTVIADTNAKIFGAFSGVGGKNILNIVGWVVVIILLAGVGYWYFGVHKRDKKIFNKFISVFEVVGAYWQLVKKDVAKVIKIGTGGFEILYLKAHKTWKIAYGGRIGKDTYYFFIMPDGYWYNGMMYANISAINDKGGLIPIVTTNPLMRGQYTALEKQIDSLTANKKSFWDKYGMWVMSIAFILIAGVLMWLMFKEFSTGMGSFTTLVDKMGQLIDKVNIMQGNAQANIPNGLVPVK